MKAGHEAVDVEVEGLSHTTAIPIFDRDIPIIYVLVREDYGESFNQAIARSQIIAERLTTYRKDRPPQD